MGKGKGKVKGKLVKNVHKHKCKYKVHNLKIEFSCEIFTEFFQVWTKFHKKKNNKNTSLQYDVALVTLKKKFDLKHATPICLVSTQLDKVPQNPLEISGKLYLTICIFFLKLICL